MSFGRWLLTLYEIIWFFNGSLNKTSGHQSVRRNWLFKTPVFPGAISRILVQQAILGLQADKKNKIAASIFSPLKKPSKWCEFIGLKELRVHLWTAAHSSKNKRKTSCQCEIVSNCLGIFMILYLLFIDCVYISFILLHGSSRLVLMDVPRCS